jgi:4-amino-4-deoxy-L-arabinose transferase-like glycosyltransferase
MKPQDSTITSSSVMFLFGCLLAAAALRVFHLDFQSLWLDELFSVVFSRSDLGLPQIAAAYADDVHPLGYPLLLHWWLGFFGDTDLAARALSVVFGVLGVAAMFAAGRRCFDTRTGVIAAVLTTVNAFHIAYSQEARAYSLVFLLASLSYWAFLAVLARPGWRTAVAYGLATAAAIHVHYYGFVVLFGQVAAALVMPLLGRWNWRRVRPLLAGATGAALTVLPWIGPLVRVAGLREAWPAQPTPFFFFEYFNEYFGNQMVLSVAFGILLVALPFLLHAEPSGDAGAGRLPVGTAAGLLGGAVAVSLVAAYVRSVLVVPMLVPKVTIAFLPVLFLLIALAISRIAPAQLGVAVAAGLTAASLLSLFSSGYYNQPHKEQWREAVEHMLTDPVFDPGADLCLGALAPGFQFYVDQFGTHMKVEEADPQRLLAAVNGRPDVPRVWLLVARDEDAVRSLRQELRRGWVRKDRVEFLKTSVERWEPETATHEEPHDP